MNHVYRVSRAVALGQNVLNASYFEDSTHSRSLLFEACDYSAFDRDWATLFVVFNRLRVGRDNAAVFAELQRVTGVLRSGRSTADVLAYFRKLPPETAVSALESGVPLEYAMLA